MDWKNLAWGALLSSSLVFAGCGDDDGVDPGTDAGMDMDGGGAEPMDLDCGGDDCFFVADDLVIPTEDPPGVVNGFDLDGRVSDDTDAEGCFQPDFTSPDGTMGVDNQLATLAPTLEGALGSDLDATIAEALGDGSIIILMELDGAETTEDDSVTLNLYLGELTADDTCAMDAEPMCITAGKTFDINGDSVDASGNALISVPATITGGTLMAEVDTLELNIPFDEGTNIELTIRNATVRADVGSDTLENGLIGGQLNIEELITTVMAVGGEDIPVGLVRSTFETVADLDADADGVCQAVSVGIEFGAVGATKGDVATGA